MYSITINKEKNRLYIRLDAIDSGEGKKLVHRIQVETAKLNPGFSCVSDISNYSLSDSAETVWADIALKTLANAGMVRAIRVTGYDVTYRETKEKYGYIVGLAKTVPEADEILNRF